ncbi:hypothetical protein B0H17DRAFT_1290387 [Mycena rosella]|uniref:Transposase n=1 Tax=Mycena rosella TaxID=1033263 RepID=A0AAD7FFZ5_MYCRO|nr:hypothetical protein B0H17DRAFT_1290387 [Mycena rosella]
MAPTLLKGRFAHPKYHTHACELSEIIKACLKFTITYPELDTLEEQIIQWVQTYERYYYQYREDRLRACPLVVHGLLHVVSDIRFCGPSWTTWTFYMERYCGFLKAGLRSRRFPWANLNNRVLNYAYLEQIGSRYDLTDELEIFGRRSRGPSQSEKVYADYPENILRVPYRKAYTPDDILRRKIAGYFSSALGKPINTFLALLPKVMPSWGKVRILDGDSIRSASAAGKGTGPERDSSYVRYELQVQERTRRLGHPIETRWVPQIFYGRLEQILVCDVPKGELWGGFSGKTRLLAVITPCSTGGKDATEEIVSYDRMTTQIVTDLQTISSVVGRIKTRGKWTIIDRSGGLIKPEFIAELVEEELRDNIL